MRFHLFTPFTLLFTQISKQLDSLRANTLALYKLLVNKGRISVHCHARTEQLLLPNFLVMQCYNAACPNVGCERCQTKILLKSTHIPCPEPGVHNRHSAYTIDYKDLCPLLVSAISFTAHLCTVQTWEWGLGWGCGGIPE